MVFTSSDVVGVAERCITVRAVDDDTADPDERFTVIVNSTNLRVNITANTTTVVITDNDGNYLHDRCESILNNCYNSFASTEKSDDRS